jgi:DNA-binding MarR family transcriptional regulator
MTRAYRDNKQQGVRNSQVRLTPAEVLLLRVLRRNGWTQMQLAVRFGVSQGHVSKICRGFKWSKRSMRVSGV